MKLTLVGAARGGKATRFAPAAILVFAAALVALPAHAFTDGELKAARTAIAASDAGKSADARQAAERAHFPLLAKLVEWLDLTRPGTAADFPTLARFIDQNQDWPSQGLLKKHAEDAITDAAPTAQVVDWFQRSPPAGPNGASRFVDALVTAGHRDQAVATARQFLSDGTMTGTQLSQFATRYAAMLRPVDFELRADRLIWAGDDDGATTTLPFLSADARAVAQTRIALANQAPNAQSLLSRLSKEQQNDLGILFDRMRWLRRQNRDAEAIALLDIAPPTLPHADQWWSERSILARRALETGDPKTAYQLARDHRQATGSALADGEWFSGWIALRFLNDPKAALTHFDLMLNTVGTPISLARAAYWGGRAEEALGDKPAADSYYGRAANHIGTFYGQLALAKLNPSAKLSLPPQPPVAGLEARAFGNRELVQVAQLFNAIGLSHRADPFVRRIGELARTSDDALLAMRLAKVTNSLAAEVLVAKRLMQGGMPLLADGYPFINPLGPNVPEPALVHAIIRQESLFDAGATSPSGALGLMQLMPATAKTVANKLHERKHKTALLTDEPSYNVKLGSAYLADLIDHFSGSYVLAVAGYNAGPGRVAGWLRDNGDPRTKLDETIDWIEKIGVSETRNYVQRVIENLEVYRARMVSNHAAPNMIVHDLVR